MEEPESSAESLLILEGVGIQLRTTYFLGSIRHRFYAQSRIRDIIIVEGISMCRIFFYLSFLIDGEEAMVLAFQVQLTATQRHVFYLCAAPSASFEYVDSSVSRRSVNSLRQVVTAVVILQPPIVIIGLFLMDASCDTPAAQKSPKTLRKKWRPCCRALPRTATPIM